MIAHILASGPSMSREVAERARDEGGIIVAVSDSFRLAPFATALVSQDPAWWDYHRAQAMAFGGRKFSGNRGIPGVDHILYPGRSNTGLNSGALAIYIAAAVLGGNDLRLHGFDMHGTHFFGNHPKPLKTPTAARCHVFQAQFYEISALLSSLGVSVRNCTEGSRLKAFPAFPAYEMVKLSEPEYLGQLA